MDTFSDIGIALLAGAVLSGAAAFFGLFSRQDSKIRLCAIGPLTLGLFVGFSIVWAVIAIYLKHRFAGDQTLQVPYLGVQLGIVIISLLCGLVLSERSAHAPPPNVTILDQRWVTSPRRAFGAGITIAVLAPTGFGALTFLFWAISTLFK